MRFCGFFWRLFPCFLCGFAGAALRVSVGAVRMACGLEKNTQRDIFFTFKVWLILKRLLSLYCIQKHISMYLTDREKELVEALRNYRRAYPNGARNLEIYIL